tara:strand:- start:179 stop:409 length:231 start_codon:yes stop_codon:yes gene_type:complete
MSSKKNSGVTERQIITSVKQLVDIIQLQTKNNLVEKSRELTVDRNELEAMISIIDASIMNAFTSGIDRVVKDIKDK